MNDCSKAMVICHITTKQMKEHCGVLGINVRFIPENFVISMPISLVVYEILIIFQWKLARLHHINIFVTGWPI